MLGIGFVYPHDADLVFGAFREVFIEHRGAKKDLIRRGPCPRIDHFGRLDALVEKADAPVDFAQAPLAVLIVAVFAAVAIARRPAHNAHHLGALDIDELLALFKKPAVAGLGHIVLRVGGQPRKPDFLAVLVL